jgi:hypothetical protein
VTDTQTVFNLHPAREQALLDGLPFLEWTFPDGTLWTRFYRFGDGYLLRFPYLGDFTVSADGLDVTAYPVAGVSDQTIEHLYLNQVLPLALSRQFKLVLHASAVEIENFAVAFLGVSGRGKSTLAASFSTSGCRFLTDDGLQLEKGPGGYLIQPSHPSIRLWDDSRQALIPESAQVAPPVDFTPKSRFLADDEVAYCDAARPLCCVYFLGEGATDTVLIEPVSGRDAMIELVRHSFLLDIEAREMLMHHFGQLTDLARMPMFFRLDYPRRYELLPMVREAVIRHAVSLNAAEVFD